WLSMISAQTRSAFVARENRFTLFRIMLSPPTGALLMFPADTAVWPLAHTRYQNKAMPDQLSNLQHIRKPAIRSKAAIVAAQSRLAAEIGADVLAAGGDCIDAAVATGFALGAVEPWMNGVGGGGAMVLYRAREDRFEVIDYGMRAPESLRVEDYPLTE